MKSNLIFLILLFFSIGSFGQALKKEDLLKIVIENQCDTNSLFNKGFITVYDGPKKNGGTLIHFQNSKANELLFVNYFDNGNFQYLAYYLSNKNEYNKLYLELKKLNLNVLKRGKTYENNKVYYHLQLMFNN